MFDLIATRMQQKSDWDAFRSHPHKFLRVHTHGVLAGVEKRTNLSLPQVAAVFHDLGKLNPNFQPKLDNQPVSGYSSHAYLSAWAFLRFCQRNSALARSLGVVDQAAMFAVVTMIAHHHGSLPDLREILSVAERERMAAFLQSGPELAASDYLKVWLDHQPFILWDSVSPRMLEQCAFFKDKFLDTITQRLDFFLNTQFGFAALLEADKRDAGDNRWFRREEQLTWARENFSSSLETEIFKARELSVLNKTRTEMREEAVQNIREALTNGSRVFSLTAPTGAGKTFTLLALSAEIRRLAQGHSVCYTLPFLTITEQVENICRDMFGSDFVTRIDSRSRNPEMERLLKESEDDPEKAADILSLAFSDETFDAAFTITTFVQVFESLLTNRGASVMRLPNFAKTIFLVDEIQALPPRLYVFLTAYLQAFCEKFDSYAILSTATMPALELLEKHSNARALFSGYKTPTELLAFEKYYTRPVFDRYQIIRIDKDVPVFTLDTLKASLEKTTASCLVILNTIDDTIQFYKKLCPHEPNPEIVLLNTRFTLKDRQEKIAYCKERLEDGERIILISTSLIEAGVDIDFPVVYRDLCPLPSLIQSAGRCNRNGKRKDEDGNLIPGEVRFFTLVEEFDGKMKPRAMLIYRDQADQWSLDFTRQQFQDTFQERNLLEVQKAYFAEINKNLEIGRHRLCVDKKANPPVWRQDNLVSRVNEMAFEIVGSFQLIDEAEFGQERRYYVPENDKDHSWEELGRLAGQVAEAGREKRNFEVVKVRQAKMEDHLRQLTGRVVQIRVRSEAEAPPAKRRDDDRTLVEYCGLYKLLLPDIHYSLETGLQVNGQGIAIL